MHGFVSAASSTPIGMDSGFLVTFYNAVGFLYVSIA